jgi:hypothetical protein
MVDTLEDSDGIHFDGDKDQSDTCAASSAGDETRSVGVQDNELPTAMITVKGIILLYNNE